MNKKISYFNCTAIQAHIGCYAVTDAHFRMLFKSGYEIIHISPLNKLNEFKAPTRQNTVKNIEESYVAEIIKKSDAIIINGEGTIHHGGGTILLCLAEVSINFNKPVFLVNAVIQDVEGYDDILNKVADLNVREIKSSEYLKSKNIKHRVVLDSILEAKFNGKSNLDFKNKIVLTDWHKQRDSDVGIQITKFERIYRDEIIYLPIHHLYHIENENWRGIVKSLSEAKVIITGRHHAIYLAGLANIPFVALPSNTYKVEGLLEMGSSELAFCAPDDDLEEKMQYVLNNQKISKDFHNYLISNSPLTTFDKLYELLPSSSSLSDLEIDNEIKKLFKNLIKITVNKEIQNSYTHLQLRVHQTNKITNLANKEKKLSHKIKVIEDRMIILRESRQKSIDNFHTLRDKFINFRENTNSNMIFLKEQLSEKNEKIKELNTYFKAIKIEENKDELIDKYMYQEWLNIYEKQTTPDSSDDFKLKLAMSYQGTLDFDSAVLIWESLIDVFPILCKKNLARIYIERHELNQDTEIFEAWNEKFALLLAKKDYDNAWMHLLQRPKTQKLISSNRHCLIGIGSSENILLLPDGGIGDELRNSIIYTKLSKLYSSVTIACEQRLYNMFSENFPEITFVVNTPDLEKEYDKVVFVYDLFHKISPFDKDTNTIKNLLLFRKNHIFMKPNKYLSSYWENYLKKKAGNKKIIGICQGSHIHSFDRISNIFKFDLWTNYLSDDYLFVNLSFDYFETNKTKICNLTVNYKNDFDTLAAVITACDYVITPANTILDYCGSLGQKTIALYTGYKFKWRFAENNYDKIHANTIWIGSDIVGDKDSALEFAFTYLNEKLNIRK